MLLEALRSYVATRHLNWEEYLPYIEFAYNPSQNASTGLPTFSFVFGVRRCDLLWDLLFTGGDAVSDDDEDRADTISSTLDLKDARDALRSAQDKFRERHAAACKPHNLCGLTGSH